MGSRKATWNLLDEEVEDPSPDFLRPNEERLFARTILDRVGTTNSLPNPLTLHLKALVYIFLKLPFTYKGVSSYSCVKKANKQCLFPINSR